MFEGLFSPFSIVTIQLQQRGAAAGAVRQACKQSGEAGRQSSEAALGWAAASPSPPGHSVHPTDAAACDVLLFGFHFPAAVLAEAFI